MNIPSTILFAVTQVLFPAADKGTRPEGYDGAKVRMEGGTAVVDVAVDITDEFDTKVKALECHKSQFAWMSEFGNNRFTESMRIRAAFYGLRYDCKYAEVFRAWRFCSYMPDFKLLP